MKLILLGLLLTILVACELQSPESTGVSKEASPIYVGSLLPLTGDAAQYGIEFQRVAEIAVEEINSQGGINGAKLEILYEDSKCNAKDAASAAKKLIEVSKVKMILGGACSSETLGAAPIVEQNKVVMISPSSTSPDVTNAGDFVFRTSPSDAYTGKVAAEQSFLMKHGRVAILHETTDYAQGISRVFERSFKGKVVATEGFASDATDFKTPLTKIKAVKPEAIFFVIQTPSKAPLILKQMKELGIKSQIIMDGMIRGTLKTSADLLEGAIGVEPKFDANSDKAKGLFEKYRLRYGGETFGFYDAATYDAVYLIADAISKHGEDTEAMKQFLYSVTREGAMGILAFDQNGDVLTQFSIMQVKNGALKEIRVSD